MSNRDQLSRRAFVVGTAAAAAAGGRSIAAGGSKPSTASPLTALSACDAVQRMVRGELTAERYAGALLARCESQRALNAFITLEPERVLEQARACDLQRRAGAKPGPLFGLPIPVKDSVNTQEYATTAGPPALRNAIYAATGVALRRLPIDRTLIAGNKS